MTAEGTPRQKTTGRLDISPAPVLMGRVSRAGAIGALAIASLGGLFAACSQGTEERPPGVGWTGNGGAAGDGGGGSGGSDTTCIDGEQKECVVTLGEHDGVLSCFHGVQACEDGLWGRCKDGTVKLEHRGGGDPSEKPSAPPGILTNCLNNPCDPTCKNFDEDPDGGIKSTGQMPIFTWQTGDLGGFPSSTVSMGMKEPCSTGSDCQFNQYCSAPVSGTCEHNKCAVGEAMTWGCDTCVDSICAIDQTCCKTTYGGTCDHDYCNTGDTMVKGCDPCVTAICNADPSCCGGTCAHDYCDTGTKLTTGCDPCVTTVCMDDPKCCGLATQGSCAHDYCATGASLTSGCSPAVTAVCAADPFCCKPPPATGSCAHNYCNTGTKLNANCNACVAKVCAQKPSCCSNNGNAWNSTCVGLVETYCNAAEQCSSWDSQCVAEVESIAGDTCTAAWGQTCVNKVQSLCGKSCQWDQSCVNKVASVCGKSCGPFNWTQSCADKVKTVCADTCYPDPPCAHNKCASGGPLAAACDPCVSAICAQLPSCCTTAWTDLCVDRVKTLCGEGCNVKGDCVPWLPGQKDPTCAGYDLSLGVGCGASVPVCNHGNTTVPAGVRVIHFPSGTGQFPKCAPNQATAGMQACTTQLPIAPGKCINLDAASCGLGATAREIMVNPPPYNGSVQLPECQCQDNWTLWPGSNVACQAPSCSNTTTATVKRVNMFVALDKSGSMGTNVGNGDTRWTATVKALKKFFQDTGSAGLGVALRFWPDNSPVSGCDDVSCSTNACKQPYVNLGVLKLASAPTDTQEQALVTALNAKSPGGNTPMSAALAGATQWAITYKAGHPTEDAIVVLATDGEPNGCNEDPTQIANIAGNAFNGSGIKTYAIGLQDANPAFMDQIALAGGTKKGFFVAPGANVENDLLAAMIQIKGDTLSCDFIVPSGNSYDPSVAVVKYVPSVGAPVLFTNVANLAACGAGWYYDDPANPSQLKLCPSTCQTILNDTGAKITVDLGCPADYDPVTYTYPYEANCPQGTKVQWGYFAYDTLTAADSSVVFKARTATTLADIASASYVTLGTAKASPDTQVCPMSGPAPCPIDMVNKLGLPDARYDHLELQLTVYPATTKNAGAVVKGWDLTYSCPPSE